MRPCGPVGRLFSGRGPTSIPGFVVCAETKRPFLGSLLFSAVFPIFLLVCRRPSPECEPAVLAPALRKPPPRRSTLAKPPRGRSAFRKFQRSPAVSPRGQTAASVRAVLLRVRRYSGWGALVGAIVRERAREKGTPTTAPRESMPESMRAMILIIGPGAPWERAQMP